VGKRGRASLDGCLSAVYSDFIKKEEVPHRGIRQSRPPGEKKAKLAQEGGRDRAGGKGHLPGHPFRSDSLSFTEDGINRGACSGKLASGRRGNERDGLEKGTKKKKNSSSRPRKTGVFK